MGRGNYHQKTFPATHTFTAEVTESLDFGLTLGKRTQRSEYFGFGIEDFSVLKDGFCSKFL
jgi:hypothetical protein